MRHTHSDCLSSGRFTLSSSWNSLLLPASDSALQSTLMLVEIHFLGVSICIMCLLPSFSFQAFSTLTFTLFSLHTHWFLPSSYLTLHMKCSSWCAGTWICGLRFMLCLHSLVVSFLLLFPVNQDGFFLSHLLLSRRDAPPLLRWQLARELPLSSFHYWKTMAVLRTYTF